MTLDRPTFLKPIDSRPHILRCGMCRSENVTNDYTDTFGSRHDCRDCGHNFSHPFKPNYERALHVKDGRKVKNDGKNNV